MKSNIDRLFEKVEQGESAEALEKFVREVMSNEDYVHLKQKMQDFVDTISENIAELKALINN